MKLEPFLSLLPFINDALGSTGGEFFIDNRPWLYFFLSFSFLFTGRATLKVVTSKR